MTKKMEKQIYSTLITDLAFLIEQVRKTKSLVCAAGDLICKRMANYLIKRIFRGLDVIYFLKMVVVIDKILYIYIIQY